MMHRQADYKPDVKSFFYVMAPGGRVGSQRQTRFHLFCDICRWFLLSNWRIYARTAELRRLEGKKWQNSGAVITPFPAE